MNSGPSALRFIRRSAQVRFLAIVGALSFCNLPAYAADAEPAPGDLPAPAVVEPTAANCDASAQMLGSQIKQFMMTVAEKATSFVRFGARAQDTFHTDVTTSTEPVVVVPLTPEAPPTEIQAKETEIDSITAQIEEEKARSARRIAELEEQLTGARNSLTSITNLDNEGFIRGFLVLGPIPLDEKVSNHDEESNKDFLDRAYVPANATPKDGDSVEIDDVSRTWQPVKADDYFVDLAKVANEQELDAEHAAYLGVAYVISDDEVSDVKLATGSDDDSVWRLNGKEVIRSYQGRGVDKDQDVAEGLTLKRGVNVLSFTVLNGDGPTAAAARFLDENGEPVKGIKISLTPPSQTVAQTDNAPATGTDEPAK